MKKFFAIFAVMFAVIFVGKVSAQEVYVGTTGGLDFYVDTNSIYLINSEEFYVNVKKYNGNGSLNNNNEWKFYVSGMDGEREPIRFWAFDYYLSGKWNSVSGNKIAREILRVCQRYDSRISTRISY